MWTAKKDFSLRGKKYKKGDEVRVSKSLAEDLEAEGKIAQKEEKKSTKKDD